MQSVWVLKFVYPDDDDNDVVVAHSREDAQAHLVGHCRECWPDRHLISEPAPEDDVEMIAAFMESSGWRYRIQEHGVIGSPREVTATLKREANNDPARVLAARRQIEEMDLTLAELETLIERHAKWPHIASKIIFDAAVEIRRLRLDSGAEKI